MIESAPKSPFLAFSEWTHDYEVNQKELLFNYLAADNTSLSSPLTLTFTLTGLDDLIL
jgi:hypothetical protein